MIMTRIVMATVVFVASVASCATDGENLGETDDEVIGGAAVGPGAYPAVVAYKSSPNAGIVCTATKVSANVFITAAHCVTHGQCSDPLQCPNAHAILKPGFEIGSRIYMSNAHQGNNGPDPTFIPVTIHLISVEPTWYRDAGQYRGDLRSVTRKSSPPASDVAVIQVVENTPWPTTSIGAQGIDLNAPATMLGVGCETPARTQGTTWRKKALTTAVIPADQTTLGGLNGSYFGRQHMGGPNPTGGCPGDSGGPVLQNGVVVGVNSHVVDTFNGPSYTLHTRVEPGSNANSWVAAVKNPRDVSVLLGPIEYWQPGQPARCLDVSGVPPFRAGDNVQLWQCSNNAHQRWAFTPSGQLLLDGTNLCLDVPGGPGEGDNGRQLQLWHCNDAPHQKWAFVGEQLVGLFGKCVDVPSGVSRNGAPIQMWQCLNNFAQKWQVPTANGS